VTSDGPKEAAPSVFRRARGLVGRKVRALRRAFAGPPVEEAVVDERLPLPSYLVALDTEEGSALLAEAGDAVDFHQLHDHFVPQRSPSFCGPATIAIVLNALHAGAGAPARRYDQDTVFTDRTEAVKPRIEVIRGGMGLPILAGYLVAHDLRGEACFASDFSVDEFRDRVVPLLVDDDTFVAVNFHRPTLGQQGTGHISPLAAYHEEATASSCSTSRATATRRSG